MYNFGKDVSNPTSQNAQSTSQNSKTNFISKCLFQYQQKMNQQGQFSDYQNQQQIPSPQQFFAQQQSLKYYGYQDKKSITIKPIHMHKDLISLKKQNQQKKSLIQQLQKQNTMLKQKYHKCIVENQKVQKFLKDIQFTFKNDKKTQKANQIMLKAKRMLYRQAIECQNNVKKITKSSQANTVQQIKMYIEFLQSQKQRLTKFIQTKKKNNLIIKQQQDFNQQNQQKFERTMQYIQKMLNIQIQRSKRHSEVYKIQKSMVSTGLKQKEIYLKKKSIQKYYQKLKDLLLKKQGEQYEIVVLQKKRKDKIKLIQEMKQFKSDIKYKKSSILQYQKQLKQKMKTYDYMSKWTKQLKMKLQQKKQNHSYNKTIFEQKINQLSKEFEEWNERYKAELDQDLYLTNGLTGGSLMNMPRKKGTTKQILFNTGNANKTVHTGALGFGVPAVIKKNKVVKIEQIRKIIKKIKLWILQNQIHLDQFLKKRILQWNQSENISNHLKNDDYSEDKKVSFFPKDQNNMKILQQRNKNILKHNQKKNSEHSASENTLINSQGPKISFHQLLVNLKSQILILNEEPHSELIKLLRYVFEDNTNSASSALGSTNTNQAPMIRVKEGLIPNIYLNKKLAFTIMFKLFESQLKSFQDIEQTKFKFKEFLIKFYDPFRYDILKNLLSMGGLKGLQKINQLLGNKENQNTSPDQIRQSNLQSTQKSNQIQKSIRKQSTTNGSSLGNMKKNHQLHLQLDLDQAILLNKLRKHVVQQFYIVRFKQLIDLMIWQQFSQIERPRLGMFDRICQIITQKKLIKENITRNYNFKLIEELEQKEKELMEQQKIRKQNQKVQNFKKIAAILEQNQQVLQEDNKDQNLIQNRQNFWLVQNPRPSRLNVEFQQQNQSQKQNYLIKDKRKISQGKQTEYPQRSSASSSSKKKRTWLDDLMSDHDDEIIQGHDHDDIQNYQQYSHTQTKSKQKLSKNKFNKEKQSQYDSEDY